MSEPNPYTAPDSELSRPVHPLLRRILWQAAGFGGVILAFDVGGWMGMTTLGVIGIVMHFALFVGGVTGGGIALLYLAVEGRQSASARELAATSVSFVALSVALTAVLFAVNP